MLDEHRLSHDRTDSGSFPPPSTSAWSPRPTTRIISSGTTPSASSDLSVIRQRRGAANRLGFAVQLS